MIRDIVTRDAILEILRGEIDWHRSQLITAHEAEDAAERFGEAFSAQLHETKAPSPVDLSKEAMYLRYEDLLDMPTLAGIKVLFKQIRQVRQVCDSVTKDLERAILEIEKV